MNIPCDRYALCIDEANPFINLSSEAPDANIFFAYGSGPGASTGTPSGPGSGGPRPGGNYDAQCSTANGPIWCAGATQADADLCVQRMGVRCQPPNGDPPLSPPISPADQKLYGNQLASCSVSCPDGSPFTYQVAPNLFFASSQIVADRMASSYACTLANTNKVCMGTFSRTTGCSMSAFTSSMTVSGRGPFTFSVINGSLPTGTHLSSAGNTATISGTPTTPGNYSFILRAVGPTGNFMQKAFAMSVIGLTSGALPNFTSGAPYSFQLTATGGTGHYTFVIIFGALPSGLTLSAAGLISGTPVSSSNASFSVAVTDH